MISYMKETYGAGQIYHWMWIPADLLGLLAHLINTCDLERITNLRFPVVKVAPADMDKMAKCFRLQTGWVSRA